ncbi:MAG: peptidylprolyl isomerase [Candidatus Eremiobacteraeota bacterium]|nr:peptidylprolyl isomerase [Candidatus Eremiobacteraeota bacterium]MBC5826394.1 peptidylprolyl isomerase [Candidatus Eremiobacteraeota bacterium]
MNRSFVTRILAIAAACAALAGAACSNPDDKAVATVNGQKITKGQLDARLEGCAAPQCPGGKTTLQQIVQQQLVFQYAKDNKIDVTDAEINAELDKIKQRFPGDQFQQVLKTQGLTLDDAKNVLREQLIVRKAVDKNIHLSDADVKSYFTKNSALFNTPAQMRARHILVKSKAEADSIEAQLRKGANFADLARKYSVDPGSKDKGGELGFFGPGQMLPQFDAAAHALKPGQISPPVQTSFGWHIIQLEEKKPGGVANFASSQTKIRDQLTQAQEQQYVPQFLEQLRSKAKIEINDPRFADLFPSPPPGGMPGAPPAGGPPAGAPPAAQSTHSP